MSDSIASLAPTSDSTYGQGKSRKPPTEEAGSKSEADGEFSGTASASELSLIIEDDPAEHTPVYKTVDRRTGTVVRKLDNEQLLRLGKAETYVAGQLIKTRV
jgi:flagellar protein FlaG